MDEKNHHQDAAEDTHPRGLVAQPARPHTDQLDEWLTAPFCGIGHLDEINGDSAQTRTVAISRFEARLIAKHWVERLARAHRFFSLGYSGSREIREDVYCPHRLQVLLNAGLITKPEIDAMFAEEETSV
jgi:hypothetical protein